MYFKYLKDAVEYAKKYLKDKRCVYRFDSDMKMYYISPV